MQHASKRMSLNKRGDQERIYFEMIRYGSEDFIPFIRKLSMHWSQVVLRMTVSATCHSRWFPKLVTWRRQLITDHRDFIRVFLDCYNCLIAVKLVVAETIISKCNEFNLSLWIASFDIEKAFDRVSRACIFDALRPQGSMNQWLLCL